jgi:hypothetical protein
MSFRRIEEVTGISKSTAHRIAMGRARKEATRRSQKATAWREKTLKVARAMKEVVGTAVFARMQQKYVGFDVSVETIRRWLRADGYTCVTKPRVPLLGAGDPPKRVRVCKYLLTRGMRALSPLFADEKYFELGLDCVRRCYVKRGQERPTRPRAQFPQKLHVWVCAGIGIKILVIVPRGKDIPKRHGRYEVRRSKRKVGETRGRKTKPFGQTARAMKERKGMDSELFIDLCIKPLHAELQRLRGSGRYFLVHDGASCHHSKQVTDYMAKHTSIQTTEWCPRSADLNVAENVLSALQYGVCRREKYGGPPTTVDELERRLRAEFAALSMDRMVETWPERLRECVRLGGKCIADRWRLRGRRADWDALQLRSNRGGH